MATELKSKVVELLKELKGKFEKYKTAKEPGEKFATWVEYARYTPTLCKIVCEAAFDKKENEDQYLKCFGLCVSKVRAAKTAVAFSQIVDRLINVLREVGAPDSVIEMIKSAAGEIGVSE